MIVSDNGTELTSNAVLAWCGEVGVSGITSRPVSMQNGYVESFVAGCGRASQRDVVLEYGSCPCRDRGLGRRLQSGATTPSLGYATPAAFAAELISMAASLRPTGSATQPIASTALMRKTTARL